jgi:hypothetical protein
MSQTLGPGGRSRRLIPRARRTQFIQTDPLVPNSSEIASFRAVERRMLERKPACVFCDHPAEGVWPLDLSYPTMRGEVPEALLTMCNHCAADCVRLTEHETHLPPKRRLPVGAIRMATKLGRRYLIEGYECHSAKAMAEEGWNRIRTVKGA